MFWTVSEPSAVLSRRQPDSRMPLVLVEAFIVAMHSKVTMPAKEAPQPPVTPLLCAFMYPYLIGVLPRVALALAAHAVSPVVAERGGGVVRPAAGLQVAVEAEVLGAALAPPAEEVGRAAADAAHVRALEVALRGVLDVALE